MTLFYKKLFFGIVLAINSVPLKAQWVYVEFEPYAGMQFDQKLRVEEVHNPAKGLTYIFGLNSYVNISDYFALKGGLAVRKEPHETNTIGQISSIVTFAFLNEKSIALSVEFGLEFNDYSDVRTPLYFSIDQYLSKGISCAYRFRIPSFYDTHKRMSSNYNAYGVEIGLKFAFPQVLKTKPVKGHGHPFILM